MMFTSAYSHMHVENLLNGPVEFSKLLLNIEQKAMLIAFLLHHVTHAITTACLHTLLKFFYRRSNTEGKLSTLVVFRMPRKPVSALLNDSIMDVLLGSFQENLRANFLSKHQWRGAFRNSNYLFSRTLMGAWMDGWIGNHREISICGKVIVVPNKA